MEPDDDGADATRRAPHRELALVQGFPDAVRILRGWARRPLHVLVPWLLVSLAVALLLLSMVWLVGTLVDPDPTRPFGLPGRPPLDPDAATMHVLERNLVVLALHATACLAGFIIFFATREPAGDRADRLERVTRVTARVAFWFVPIATVLSIVTQAWVLGSYAATVSEHLHMTVATLLQTTLWHAIPELTAVFLPLAAWLVALRRRRVSELYAATIASVLVALPMLGVSAWNEVHRWHERVNAAPRQLPDLVGVSVGTMVPGVAAPASASSNGPVELVLGRQLDEPPLVHEQDAVRRADERSRDAGAVAVVQLGTWHVLHELRRRDDADVCGRAARGSETKPVDLLELADLRFARLGTTMPGTIVELDVEQLVDDGRILTPRAFGAPDVVQSLAAARCEDDQAER